MIRPSAALAHGLIALLAVTMSRSAVAAPPVPAANAQTQAVGDVGAHAAGLATTLLDHLDAGRFTAAEAMFSPAMRAAVPSTKLQQVWQSLAQNAGPAGPRGTPSTTHTGGMTTVAIALSYAKAQLTARISVDGNGQIAGFLVQPAPAPSPTTAPDAAAPYVEREASVGKGERTLPGTLALPKGASAQKPVPAVVLVHGSGPQDRDETIGANRPFQDIARGLAAQGIAVLRYDKRTKARPQDFAGRDFNADDEVTDDAVAAVATLRTTEGIDPNRVYVFGHSLGGMLAPRIANASGHVAGLVLMAAPARPVLDLLLEQSQRQAARDGTVSPEERAMLEDLQARVDRVRGKGDVPSADTPMALPATYWRSLDRIEPVRDAIALDQPILVIHGGRDIQVVEADRQHWLDQLSTHSNARLRHYPALNHLGIAGNGPATVEEYFVPGSVDAGMINDIALWIQEH